MNKVLTLPRHPGDVLRLVAGLAILLAATATAACPDTNPRPLSWGPRRWTPCSRSAGRSRPTSSLIQRAASHTPMPVTARLTASQNRRVAATTSDATPTASTLPACMTAQNAG